jgi:hypothetical protein
MWAKRLRTKMMFMTSLLSQPYSAARSDMIVRASLLRRLRSRFA